MPTDKMNEPDDDAINEPNEMVEVARMIQSEKGPIGFDPKALFAASEAALAAIHNQLKKELKPRAMIERMYVEDLATIIWNMRKLYSIKNGIIRNALYPALKAILQHIVAEDAESSSIDKGTLAKTLAVNCYRDKKARAKVAKLLADFNLDESCVEAEAWRFASTELDLIERQLTSLQVRRDKTLNMFADYRDELGQRLKLKVQRISEADEDEDFDAMLSPEAAEPGEFLRLS